MDFTGKVVVITGAGGGIGSAVAKKFAVLGARLALVSTRVETADRTAKSLSLPEDRVFCVGADLTDETAAHTAVAAIMGHYGRIDALVNTAGIPGPSARTEDYPFSEVRRVFSVNVFGTFLMMQAVLPIMQAQRSGAVVNFGSVSGMFGYPYEIAYGASKAAVIFMTKNAANENGGNGVRVNAISPGWVDTGMMRTILDSYKDVGIENSADNVTLGPMGRPGTPEEIANVAAFLCSEESSYVNGANFLVDGGMTLG